MTKYIADWRRPAVPERIRQGNRRCCLPLLVSIGPIFHGLPELKDVEDLKPEISHNFIRDCISSAGNKFDTFKKKLYSVGIEMKSYYSEETRKRFADAQFYKMLLFDVCFVVVVIHGIVSKNERKLPLSSSVLRMCLRDIFLLENQIPFLLVQDLVKLRFGRRGTKIIHQLLSAVIHHPLTSNHMDKQPLHLLDLLRHTYIGIGQSPAQGSDSDCPNKFFSARQLHDRGVRFWEAVSRKIGYSIVQMEFDANFGNLYMPPLLIDESFESIFLNIAAYEASRCDLRKFEVTTYLCLLQHLARDPESVGVLRNNVIRTKEDNKSIVKMFQRLCENLQPNFQPYDRLLSELQFFPTGFIASIICWSRQPSTTHLVSRVFFTSAVLATIIALADILSFLVNSSKNLVKWYVETATAEKQKCEVFLPPFTCFWGVCRVRVQFIRGLVWLCFKNICGKSTNPEGLLQVNCRVTSTPTQLPDIQPQLLQVNQLCACCNSLTSQDCIRTKDELGLKQ